MVGGGGGGGEGGDPWGGGLFLWWCANKGWWGRRWGGFCVRGGGPSVSLPRACEQKCKRRILHHQSWSIRDTNLLTGRKRTLNRKKDQGLRLLACAKNDPKVPQKMIGGDNTNKEGGAPRDAREGGGRASPDNYIEISCLC